MADGAGTNSRMEDITDVYLADKPHDAQSLVNVGLRLANEPFAKPKKERKSPARKRAKVDEAAGGAVGIAGGVVPVDIVTVPQTIDIYVCEHPECGKQFDRLHNLKSHEKSHQADRPFACGQCQMRFQRNHDLKRHQRIHAGVRPYVCEWCHKSFLRLDALNRHTKHTKCRV